MAVREDAITLYGFMHQSELEMFRILIGVSGIGPQIAMNILSQIGIEDFAMAILNEDEKALTRISGIGTKSAKRLILELRDKMKKVSETMVAGDAGRASPVVHDAVSALVSLGFCRKRIKRCSQCCGTGDEKSHGAGTHQSRTRKNEGTLMS